MVEIPKQTASQWVDAIDIRSDGIKDNSTTDVEIKDMLKKDLQKLWGKKLEGKITNVEYNRFANAAKEIFQKHDASLQEIKQAYLWERKKTLAISNTALESLQSGLEYTKSKVVNISTDIATSIQQKIISENTLQTFNSADGHGLVSIEVFEKQLRSESFPMEEINGLAMKNYLIHLKSKGLLNKTVLEQRCWWAKRLLELSVLWGAKMERSEHIRDAFHKNSGFMAKTSAWIRSGTVGGIESATEHIFKSVIFDKAEQAGIKKEFFNEKGKSMNYENVVKKLIEELEREFHEKNPTGFMVTEFFKRKISEKEKKNKKLETEQKKFFGDKTIGKTFGWFWFKISESTLPEWIKNKKIYEITSDEKKILIKDIKESGKEIPLWFQEFINKQEEIDKNKQDIKNIKHLYDRPTGEAIAATMNHSWTPQKLENVMKWTIDAGRSKDNILSKEKSYKETLRQIGYSEVSIASICGDKKVLKKVLSILEAKNLATTELYRDLKPHLQFEEYKADNYVMATQNITGEQLEELKRNGMYSDSFAESLYKEDVKQKKTTDFTVPEMEKKQKYVNENHTEKNDISGRLATLHEDGKYIPLKDVIGNEDCFVKKENGKYILSINGEEEICSTEKKVKKTIDSYSFFYDMGLKSIAPSMRKFLTTVQDSNSTYPKFNLQNGFHEEQQAILLGVVDKIFDLNMGDKMAAKSTKAAIPDFKERLYTTVNQKGWFDAQLRKKWILTPGGTFNQKEFDCMLKAKREVL
ncbi:MAG: hypothetical protein ACD_71C00053G0002 [uncultured bacterium (gcode 4)]|uniref:Uncharacterized protein n=1 Tax=uncultured bacterium (gcode 4) TaxID=1234023 RepID=K1Z5C6_9BACT|nr:MAG: hypothetical protein ACD_71C00053G0002 [uncultured bacterium (gcode 4)]